MFWLNGFDIHTTNGNLTLSYIPKAGNQFGNRTLSAARRPYQGCYTASRNRERHILDNIVTVISESDTFQFNVVLGYIFILALHSWCGQQSTHTVGDCSQVEQRSQLRKNGKDRPVNLRGEHEQYQQRKQLNLTAGYQHCSNENSDAKSRLQDQAGPLNQNTGGQFYLNGDFSHGLECFIQRRETGTTKTAGFDDLDTFQVFLNLAGRLQFHIYLFVKQTELQFASAPDDEECNRHRAENRKGHSPVKKCQTDTGQGNGDNIRNQRRNSTA